MKNFWKNLALREQRLIAWGGSSLLLALLYAWAWQPIVKERQVLRAGMPTLKANVSQMSADAREVAALRIATQQKPSDSDLNRAILQAARSSNLGTDALQVSLHDQQHASLNLKSVSLDQWNALTVALATEGHIRVESCIIEPLEKSGLVRVSARLSN